MAGSDETQQNDYYALLGVGQDATLRDIQQAYRQACITYHPDKQTDSLLRQTAAETFQRVKAAYEVLSDPDKRAIYDVVGADGLSIENLEVVAREKSVLEILTQYKMAGLQREEQKFIVESNPRGMFSTTIDASALGTDGIEGVSLSKVDMWASSTFRITDQTNVNVMYSAGCTDNFSGSYSLSGRIQQQLQHGNVLAASVVVGHNARYSIEGRTSFLPIPLTVTCDLVPHKRGFAPQVAIQTRHQFSDALSLELAFSPILLLNSHFFTALHFDKRDYFGRVSINLFPNNRSRCSFQIGRRWSSGAVSGRISCGLSSGPSLRVHGEQKWSKWTTISTEIRVSASRVMMDLRAQRGSFCYAFPILLSNETPSFGSVFYGCVIPLLIQYGVRRLSSFAEPADSRKEDVDEASLMQRRKLALDQQTLLLPACERSIRSEGLDGLVIVEAVYGNLSSDERRKQIDVRIPLQALIRDHKLSLPLSSSKSLLNGFYDPDPTSQDKKLSIVYSYRRRTARVIFKDTDHVNLPIFE